MGLCVMWHCCEEWRGDVTLCQQLASHCLNGRSLFGVGINRTQTPPVALQHPMKL